MMRMRGLLIAAFVLAALSGLIWWSNRAKQAEANKPPAETSPKLINVPEDQVTRVEIKRTSGEDTALERKGDSWVLTSPKPYPVDQTSISSMLSSVASLSTDRLVEDKAADLKEYGLAAPSIEVTVTKKDGKTQRVLIGDQSPASSGYYAKLANDPRVFTIASYSKDNLDKKASDLRDKRLLTFDSNKLTRVELVAKGQDIEFGKNNQNDWQILKPRPLRADGGQVEDLIRKLQDAKLDASLDEAAQKKAAAAFWSGTQVALAKATDASGTQELTVRRDKDKNYYAKSSAVEGVWKIDASTGEGLDKGLADFRNKKLFDFGWNDPTKVEVRDGGTQVAWQKSGDKWMAGGKTMDSAAVQTVVDKLRELTATTFPESGFTTPTLEATVTSNDGKRVEKVQFAQAGKSWIAKREGEPSLYELDSGAVEDLRKAVAAVKEAAPAQAKKK